MSTNGQNKTRLPLRARLAGRKRYRMGTGIIIALIVHAWLLFALPWEQAPVPLDRTPQQQGVEVTLEHPAAHMAATPAEQQPAEPPLSTPVTPQPTPEPEQQPAKEAKRQKPQPQQPQQKTASVKKLPKNTTNATAPVVGNAATATATQAGQTVTAKPLGAHINPPPPYPKIARERGQEGTVYLLVSVDAHGTPTAIAIEKTSGSRLLDQAAIKAVEQWKFRSATVDGIAIPGTARVPVTFSLTGPVK